jgi:DNA-binding NarL/FixJ family response regulator
VRLPIYSACRAAAGWARAAQVAGTRAPTTATATLRTRSHRDLAALTARELEVLTLLASGLSNAELATN